MKILIASDAYRFQTSGAAGVVINLADNLRKMGHEVRVIALSYDHRTWKDKDDYFFGSFQSPYYPDLRLSFIRSCKLLKELNDWKPDVIHCHTEGSACRMARKIADKNNIPVVMTLHTDYEAYVFRGFKDLKILRTISALAGYIFYRNVAAVIAPSEKSRNYNTLKMVRNKTSVIPNGIKLDMFRKTVSDAERQEIYCKYGLKGGKILVNVSRLSREKDIPFLLKAFPLVLKQIPDAQMLIVGDGPQNNYLEGYCWKNGLSECVRFTGRIPNDEVYRYYSIGDVFISASSFENMPLTYLEAMACGLPLLCRDDKCLKGILKNGYNGFVFRNAREFATGACRLLNNSCLNSTMSKNSLKVSGRFSLENNTFRTLELYKKVISDKKDLNEQE